VLFLKSNVARILHAFSFHPIPLLFAAHHCYAISRKPLFLFLVTLPQNRQKSDQKGYPKDGCWNMCDGATGGGNVEKTEMTTVVLISILFWTGTKVIIKYVKFPIMTISFFCYWIYDISLIIFKLKAALHISQPLFWPFRTKWKWERPSPFPYFHVPISGSSIKSTLASLFTNQSSYF